MHLLHALRPPALAEAVGKRAVFVDECLEAGHAENKSLGLKVSRSH
jgi:hypothetical protein